MVRALGFNYVVVHPTCRGGLSMFQGFDIPWIVSQTLIAGVLHHPASIAELRGSLSERIAHRSRGYDRYTIVVVSIQQLQQLDALRGLPWFILVTAEEHDQLGREYRRAQRVPILHLASNPTADECGLFAPHTEAYERWIDEIRAYVQETQPEYLKDIEGILDRDPREVPVAPIPVWRTQLTLPNDLLTASLGVRTVDLPLPAETSHHAICESFDAVRKLKDNHRVENDYPPGYTTLLLVAASVVRRLPEVMPRPARVQLDEQAARTYRAVLRRSGEMDPRLRPAGQILDDESDRMIFERESEFQAQLIAAAVEAASQAVPVIAIPSGFGRAKRALAILGADLRRTDVGYERLMHHAVTAGELMAAALPSCALEALEKNDGTVKAIADDPIELIPVKGWTLSTQAPVVRLPASPGYVLSSAVTTCDALVLHPKDTARILVLRGTDPRDRVHGILEDVFNGLRGIERTMEIRIADVASVDDVRRELSESGAKIAIFDAHGEHRERTHGVLEIGGVPVALWTERLPMPPIVLLAACDTHPLHRPQDTVAASILNSGARTVVGTVAPVDAAQCAAFFGALLLAVRVKVKELPGPIRWSELFAHQAWSWHVLEAMAQMVIGGAFMLAEDRRLAVLEKVQERIWAFRRDWRTVAISELARETALSPEHIERSWRRYAYFTPTSLYCQLGQADSILLAPTDNAFGGTANDTIARAEPGQGSPSNDGASR